VNGGITWQGNSTVSGLYQGEYDLVVRSGVGCETLFEDYIITSLSSDLIDTVESLAPTSCNTSDGAIVIYGNNDLTNLAYSLDGVTWQTTNIFNNLNGGQYNIQVRSLSTSGCIDYDTLIISNPDSGSLSDENKIIHHVSCYGKSDGFYEVRLPLSTGDVISTENNLSAGIYVEELRDDFGCGRTVTLEILQPDPLELILDPFPIQDGEKTGGIQIRVKGGVQPYTYRIRREGDINDSLVTNPFVRDLEEARYVVIVVDSNDCSTSRVVELKDERREVFNTITPNNDGANDFLVFDRITDNECTNTNELIIFNRWGQTVYMETDYANDWEGTDLTGADLPSGAYFYVFRCYEDGVAAPIEERRSLTILRE
jgi:gliding motility-associated-like protein